MNDAVFHLIVMILSKQVSNAMQYHNTTLETTALVMHDSNTFFLCGTTFSYGSANFINIHNTSLTL